jgi:glycosyltransferase involved in cell wall biosynthesis
MSTSESAGAGRVDVIIPTANGLPYLKAAVASVLAQSHADFTLYIVDDGSTDDTSTFTQGLSDGRVRYLRKENGGPSSARNFGIQHGSGEYVAFLDADDKWYPHKLALQLSLMNSKPSLGLVNGFQEYIDPHGIVIGSLEKGLRGWVFEELLSGNFITGSGSMVLTRRAVLDRVGLFPESLNIGEDWELWLRIAREYEVDFVPEPLAAVRIHSTSAQQDARKVGDGLLDFYGLVVAEFDLRGKGRRRLARAVLYDAAWAHYTLGDRRTRTTFAQLIRDDPVALCRLRLWFRYARFVLGRTKTLAAKRVLLGPREHSIRSGVRLLDEAHVAYLADRNDGARRIALKLLRQQPRFLLYVTKWELYVKLLIGRGVVQKLKRLSGKPVPVDR